MWKISRITLRLYITLQISEIRMPPFYAERNHIQTTTTIVLPFGTAMLVVLNLMRFYPSAYQFFFRGRHFKWLVYLLLCILSYFGVQR